MRSIPRPVILPGVSSKRSAMPGDWYCDGPCPHRIQSAGAVKCLKHRNAAGMPRKLSQDWRGHLKVRECKRDA